MNGTKTAALGFQAAVQTTGKLTMLDVLAAAGANRKFVLRDIRSGLLPAQKHPVFGKNIWLFEKSDVATYAKESKKRVSAIKNKSIQKAIDSRRPAPAGFISITEMCRRTNRSVWFIYDCIRDGRLTAEKGAQGAYIVAELDARIFCEKYRYAGIIRDLVTVHEASLRSGLSAQQLRWDVAKRYITRHDIGEARTVGNGRAKMHLSYAEVILYVEQRKKVL